MSDVWLIVISTIVAIFLFALSFFLLVYYSHPDDKNEAYVPKLVVVLALTLAEISVILIALDVANLAGNPGCSLPVNYFPVAGSPNITQSPTFFDPTQSPGDTASPDAFAPTLPPTALPSPEPTFQPTLKPTWEPSVSPTLQPTVEGATPQPRSLQPTVQRAPTFAPVTAPPLTFKPTAQAPQLLMNATELTPACGGLQTALMWEAIFYIILIFCALLIPFMIFFYEAFDVDRKFGDKVCEAIQNQGLALVITGVVLGVMYSQINRFSYPVNAFPMPTAQGCEQNCVSSGRQGPFFNYNSSNMVFQPPSSSQATTAKLFISQVPISFGIYVGSFMSFFSWFLFALYTGVGLITLPADLIARFRFRPRYIPKDVYLKLREDIRTRVDTLIKLGDKMKKERRQLDDNYGKMGYRERASQRRHQRTWFLQFKKETLACEAEFEDIYLCHESWSSFNPLIPFLMLVFGIVSIALSLCWLLQIVLFILPQTWPDTSIIPTYFLNEVMTWGLLYSGFALLGVIFLAVFGLYLFACNLSGNFRIGLKFLLFEIHPMKMGGTYMSSFMVNVLLLLLQAPALVNFLALAFSNTVVNTDVDLIMNWIVRYTTFFVYFFENSVFIFMLLASMALSFVFWLLMPDDRKANQKALKKRVEKMQATIAHKERQAKFDMMKKKPAAAEGEEEGEGAMAGT